jgi:hypothetical protein
VSSLILKEHQKNCEDNNKYVEAEIAAKRIQELTAHEEERAKEGMKSRQIAEKLGIEEAHMLEFQQFNSMWDEKMKEFDHHAAALKEAMLVSCYPWTDDRWPCRGRRCRGPQPDRPTRRRHLTATRERLDCCPLTLECSLFLLVFLLPCRRDTLLTGGTSSRLSTHLLSTSPSSAKSC